MSGTSDFQFRHTEQILIEGNIEAEAVPEGPNESSLARSAWKQEKSGPVPEGRLICSLVPEIFLVELYVVRF